MKKLLVIVTTLTLVCSAVPAGAGEAKFTRLGTDPANDAPPALDIGYLDVASHHGALEIRIGVNGMLPGIGGYPELPGIEWTFDVGGRTFIAEGAVQSGQGSYYLFELLDDGSFQQLDSPEGTYNWDDGYISVIVPLDDIGARRGTKISGVGPKGTEDVDAHVHAGVTTYYPDYMATKKDFVVR